MKKLLSLIATAVLFAVGLSAQPTVVTVGDETSTDEDFGPIKSYDRNSFSEVVYLSSELQPGIITSISYHYVAGDPLLDPALPFIWQRFRELHLQTCQTGKLQP